MQAAATQTAATEKKYVLDTYVMNLEEETAKKVVADQLSELEQLRLAKNNESSAAADAEPAHENSPEKMSLRKRMKSHFSLAAPKDLQIPSATSSDVDTDSIKSTATPTSSVLSETDLPIPFDLPQLDILDENNNVSTLTASPKSSSSLLDSVQTMLSKVKRSLQLQMKTYWDKLQPESIATEDKKEEDIDDDTSVMVQSRSNASMAERRNATRRRLRLNVDADEDNEATTAATVLYTAGILLTLIAVIIGFLAPSYISSSYEYSESKTSLYDPNMSIEMVYPTDGNQYDRVNQLQWKVSGLFDCNHTRFAQVADVEVFLNDALIFADILNLGTNPETVMTLNMKDEQVLGEYAARIVMQIPLPGGKTRELETEVDYEIVLMRDNTFSATGKDNDVDAKFMQITSPSNGTLFMKDDAVQVFFTNKGAAHEYEDRKVVLLEINNAEYLVETESDVLTLNGMDAGVYDVKVSLLSGNQTSVVDADTVAFEILEPNAMGYNRLSTPELQSRLEKVKYSVNDHTTYGVIEEILKARNNENAIEQH